LSIRERALGGGHPDVARDLAALAAILDGQGRHDEADAMHRRALEIFGRGGRTGQREAAYALANLAACLHLQGRRNEAVEVAREAVSMQHRLLGARHPDVKPAEANLAIVERGAAELIPNPVR
jgi:Flp pilus assembly protein TadD